MTAEPNAPGRARELARRVREFVDTHVVPAEPEMFASREVCAELLVELQSKARSQGLWGIGYPASLGGAGLPLTSYLLVAEQEGRSFYGPAVFGAETVVDVHMLDRFATPQVRERFLLPTVRGEAVPSYGMTEPGKTGSEVSGFTTEVRFEPDRCTVRGRKWFISNADRATFMTVMARSEGLGKHPKDAFSLVVVPTDATGFGIVRELPVLGHFTGQCEVELRDVQVPHSHVVGERGAGLAVVQQRLGLARTVRSMHWLGQAQRGFDLMCRRLRSRRVQGGHLADKQLLGQHVADSYAEISAARALVRRAAARIDQGRLHVDLGVAKLAASRTAVAVLDRAVQVHGAEGLCDDTPLSVMYRAARSTRIYDGADEVQISQMAPRILKTYADSDGFDFTDPVDDFAAPA
ncbi:acyl-CoA dehydrogenase [Saccharopolyspora erythraea NRRL 2338]|uniref:Acyl-CoA dehydrogenase n=2 Tax=Saccharopolyspora erythraea TaxID=1836 RepID=A4FH69_SACEN|nr:acyl-CoA dehydrogenase family protein [Saccharopolyspora erythraea]EQD81609.1 acyl-CoA dehydrogenase [Saccharopolyspora erythraea D]PFG97094.1 acyl-CoA dehydrogenase [Saccharopolyspora erythraea NRRL 2338]QRK87304.1 acyl-CoA dehydrogenase family protein [Saccharopolyspora erythraea]CAM03394.1 acyl-CoA dehydrogenase [Saccharopolyspora erythraea NRRL 2338]